LPGGASVYLSSLSVIVHLSFRKEKEKEGTAPRDGHSPVAVSASPGDGVGRLRQIRTGNFPANRSLLLYTIV
jgi:hypothetical protein